MRKYSLFDAFQSVNFRLLWIGLLISAIGSQMQVVAINWQIYDITKSAYSLALVGLSSILPLIIIAPISGYIADRYDRRWIALIAQIIMLAVSALLMVATIEGWITSVFVFILLAINSFASSFDISARHSLYPLLVPKSLLLSSLGLINVMWKIAFIAAPAIGGLIIAYSGVGAIYSINTVSFIFIISALLLIKPDKQTVTARVPPVQAIKDGFRFVFGHPHLRSSMLMDFFASFFGSSTVLLPIFAKSILHVGAQGYGFLSSSFAIGGLLGGFIITRLQRSKRQGLLIIIFTLGYAVSTIAFGLSKWYILSLFLLMVSGFCDMVSSLIRMTLRQLVTPDSLRGRMSAINMVFLTGGPALGEFEAGIAAGIFGAPISVILGGIGAFVSTFIIDRLDPKLRKYRGDEYSI